MALSIWTQPSGYLLGTFTERTSVTIDLPVNNVDGVEFNIISGRLPSGLHLVGTQITGIPNEVSRNTINSFCIRASKNNEIQDRTFNVVIEGPDSPIFITPEGNLPIGSNGQYYVLDNTYVDFTLQAIDYDTSSGQSLKFFIAKDNGQLPGGLTLSENGRISGFVSPLISIAPDDGSGAYDNGYYDAIAYDFAITTLESSSPPKRLNRNYEFIVSVTDGDSIQNRMFRIYVVGPDTFMVDATTITADSTLFTADCINLRPPFWLTESDLGTYRANNYVILDLKVYDDSDVTFSLSGTLPLNLQFDSTTAKIYGIISNQLTNLENYEFDIIASRTNGIETISVSKTFTMNVIKDTNNVLSWATDSDLGSIILENSYLTLQTVSTNPASTPQFTLISGSLPPGLQLQIDGEITGRVDSSLITSFDLGNLITFDNNTTSIDRVFSFVVSASDQTNTIFREFTLRVADPTVYTYSNILAKPYLSAEKRQHWDTFINNTSIFTPSSLFNTLDSEFGLRTDLSMIVYAGIETKDIEQYVNALNDNPITKNKRFYFGNVLSAIAKDSNNKEIYEVVYVEMFDPLSPSTETNSYNAWRNKISTLGVNERTYLPLWMRSIQPGAKEELGFVLAIPLCYCKVGAAKNIISNIVNSGFDFKLLDYTVDRFIIDKTTEYNEDKYLKFREN